MKQLTYEDYCKENLLLKYPAPYIQWVTEKYLKVIKNLESQIKDLDIKNQELLHFNDRLEKNNYETRVDLRRETIKNYDLEQKIEELELKNQIISTGWEE